MFSLLIVLIGISLPALFIGNYFVLSWYFEDFENTLTKERSLIFRGALFLLLGFAHLIFFINGYIYLFSPRTYLSGRNRSPLIKYLLRDAVDLWKHNLSVCFIITCLGILSILAGYMLIELSLFD